MLPESLRIHAEVKTGHVGSVLFPPLQRAQGWGTLRCGCFQREGRGHPPNISKTGSISWGCLSCYTYSTNRYNTVPNQITYDANGNLLADSFNTYTWDVYGDLASANGATIIYDAFGRMVENSNGSNQFAYAPTGTNPLASMQGQTLLGAFVPLPGGAVALYNSGGLAQYNHADWLGSARLFSNPSRVAIAAMSYAPFGEGYAGGQGYVQFTSTGNAFTVYDTENQSGSLTDFTYRRYAPVQGRWIAPDPAGLAAVDPTNPQTWNRYAYVMNQPLNFTDPLGLCELVVTYINGSPVSGTFSGSDCGLPPGPPPPGCMYITNAGSGEGSGWWGTECGAGVGSSAVRTDCPPSGCPSSSGGGGGTGTPPPTTAHCAGEALAAKGFSIGLDLVGAIPGVGNLVSGTEATIRVVDGLVLAGGGLFAAGNALLNPDDRVGDASAATALGLGLTNVALGGTKAIPLLGNAVSIVTGAYDIYGAFKTYQQCMAGAN